MPYEEIKHDAWGGFQGGLAPQSSPSQSRSTRSQPNVSSRDMVGGVNSQTRNTAPDYGESGMIPSQPLPCKNGVGDSSYHTNNPQSSYGGVTMMAPPPPLPPPLVGYESPHDIAYRAVAAGITNVIIEDTHASNTNSGKVLKELDDLRNTVDAVDEAIEKEVKKKKGILGLFKGELRFKKALHNLGTDLQWLIIRLTNEEMVEGISSERICTAFDPISKKFLQMSMTLKNAGDEADSYVTFGIKDRKAVSEEIGKLCATIEGLTNLLIGNPLKNKRLSNLAQAEKLYQRGQHTISMLKKSEKAWEAVTK